MEQLYDALHRLYIIYATIGVVTLTACVYTYLTTSGNVIVNVIGMRLPRQVLFVLLPCHFVLIPWTIIQSYSAKIRAEWFISNELWFTIIAFGMSMVENMYRGKLVPIVLCICLYDWITDVWAGISALTKPAVRTGIKPSLAQIPAVLMWFMWIFQSDDIFLSIIALVIVAGNIYLMFDAVNNEGASYALLLLRLTDVSIFGWSLYVLRGLPQLIMLLSAVVSLLALLKFERVKE